MDINSGKYTDNGHKPFFRFNRRHCYILLLGCLLLPFFSMFVFASPFVLIIFEIFALIFGYFILKSWERKMKKSVAYIVAARLKKLNKPGKFEETSQLSEEIVRLTNELSESKKKHEENIAALLAQIEKNKDDICAVNLVMDQKLEQTRIAYLEFEDLRKEYHRLEEECLKIKDDSQIQLNHKEGLINEYQRTISEQRMIIEKKQRYIAKLEGKVRDLMYEIRSLLQLDGPSKETNSREDFLFSEKASRDISTSTPYSMPAFDISHLLQKCIEKAESLAGMDHLGGKSPRFLDVSMESYAVDKRRLSDSFGDEMQGIVFVYSQAEKKILFVNRFVKTALGWSQEKFMKEFPHLISSGFSDWKTALGKVYSMKESQAHLVIQNKLGKNVSFECLMSLISKGPFANHVLGILTLAEAVPF